MQFLLLFGGSWRIGLFFLSFLDPLFLRLLRSLSKLFPRLGAYLAKELPLLPLGLLIADIHDY